MKIIILDLLHTQKKLVENFTSMSFLQIANYILPLLTVPYLVRVLGPEKFGLIAFAQAFIQYFIIITDYGFNLSATRRISIFRENDERLSIIFSSVILIKIIILSLCFSIMCVLVFLINKFKVNWQVYLITFGTVIGYTLFPVWFFLGIEKMKNIAFLNVSAKLIFTISIFIFVRSQNDYLMVPFLRSIGFIIAGVLGLGIALNLYGVKLILPSRKFILDEIKEGFYIFVSNIASSLYTFSSVFILGLFTNNIIVGYYSAAEKIIRAVQYLLNPIFQTTYPHVVKLFHESRNTALKFIRKMIKIVGGFSFCISIVLLIFASQICHIILGNKYIESIPVIQILSFIPFIIGLNKIFGIQIMLSMGYKKSFMKIITTGALLSIILSLIFVKDYQHIGISIAVITTEIFIMIIELVFLNKINISLLSLIYEKKTI